MVHVLSLIAEPRTVNGKKVKQLRRDGFVPGNIYGPDMESIPVQVETKALDHALRHATLSTLVELAVGSRKHQVLVREVQRDILRQVPIHVEFFAANMENRIRAAVAIVLRGESPATRSSDAILLHPVSTVTLEGRPADLPEFVEVDVSGLTEIDQAIHASDLVLKDGITLVDLPDTLLVKVQLTKAAVEDATAAVEAGAAEGAAPAGGQGAGTGKAES